MQHFEQQFSHSTHSEKVTLIHYSVFLKEMIDKRVACPVPSNPSRW